MLYIYLPVLYYHSNLYIIEGVYAGGRGFPLSQRSFLFILHLHPGNMLIPRQYMYAVHGFKFTVANHALS